MRSSCKVNISGVVDSRVAPIIANICKEESQSLVVVSSYNRAKTLASDLSFFTCKKIYILPQEQETFIKYEAKSHEQLYERIKALKALRSGEDCILIAPALAAMKKITSRSGFDTKHLEFKTGIEIDVKKLKETIVGLGYERVDFIESPGQFSMRGGIVDIFPPHNDKPFRVELFDDEVDSIREFDITTQRSITNIKDISVYPAKNFLIDEEVFNNAQSKIYKEYTKYATSLEKKEGNSSIIEEVIKRRDELCEYISSGTNLEVLENYFHYFQHQVEHLWDYMEEGTIFVENPDRIYEMLVNHEKESRYDFTTMLERGQVIPKDEEIVLRHQDFFDVYKKDRVCIFTHFPKAIKGIDTYTDVRNVASRQMTAYNGNLEQLESDVRDYLKRDFTVNIVMENHEKLNNMKEFFSFIASEGKIIFTIGSISEGFEFTEEKVCYICENDIFNTHRKRGNRKKKAARNKFDAFTDLKVGDYIVHEYHGIGKFIGIELLSVDKEKKDYLKIKYAGEDFLYVPVDQMDLIQRYIGGEGNQPKINKLSGNEWAATKAKAKIAIEEMAKEMLEMVARRKMSKGYAFGEDTVWQKEMENMFPYVETDDQLKAIEEIKGDMESPISMDRLLCGDVGYGKTEVAARAIFKCLADGKQCAMLVPTTILANQHYYTLKERIEKFPFTVELLSRFRTKKQQEQIVKAVSEGKIDLIIGTHRLLSSDLAYKDLGLLVIDEEQRFGVTHKEKIKKLKENLDVLSLSATPIPRTLDMSLSGIKDISLIEEPPEDRYPVQTYVVEEDFSLIKDMILREINREGQVYVLYNKVKGIYSMADKIQDLVPEADVIVGHGQMDENTLENVMMEFIEGKKNVLVSTTIIESGIDIPNANTIIILDADKMGLSQLYQLRGRVGRSNKVAYAYLMYSKQKVLSETATKRLLAIKEFTELGAGFKVAMRDLEIRGAGNLLGSEQSGHLMKIGYELYCKLVEDEIHKIQGKPVVESKEEVSVELKAQANIPNFYINNESLKLEMYKKIAAIKTEEQMEEMFDELIDRFGEMPRETENLVRISLIRQLSEECSVARLHEEHGKIVFNFGKVNSLSGYALISINEAFGNSTFFHGGVEPFIRLKPTKDKLVEVIKLLKIVKENIKGS